MQPRRRCLHEAPCRAAVSRRDDDAAIARRPGVIGVDCRHGTQGVQRPAILRLPGQALVGGLAHDSAIADCPACSSCASGFVQRAQMDAGLQVDERPVGPAVGRAQQCAVFTGDPGDAGVSRMDRERLGPGEQRITRVVEWRAAGADGVARQALRAVARHVGLFVPVGIGQDAALLQAHGAVVQRAVESVAGEIAFHGVDPSGVR